MWSFTRLLFKTVNYLTVKQIAYSSEANSTLSWSPYQCQRHVQGFLVICVPLDVQREGPLLWLPQPTAPYMHWSYCLHSLTCQNIFLFHYTSNNERYNLFFLVMQGRDEPSQWDSISAISRAVWPVRDNDAAWFATRSINAGEIASRISFRRTSLRFLLWIPTK